MSFYKLKFSLLKSFLFLYQFFISLKLAVFVISSLAVLTAIGTFVESRYNQEMANKMIYHSWWMVVVMLLLAVNLSMVLIDRWPWKKRHSPFVLAHIGILILLLGSLMTKYLGLDGSIRFEEGEETSVVSVSDMEIKVYSSYDGERFSLLYEKPVDMFFIRPEPDKPYIVSTSGEEFVIDQYLPFSVGREFFKPALRGGPAVRFHLSGSQADVVEWMRLDTGKESVRKTFGPAVIHLTRDKSYTAKTNKELVLFNEGEKLFYSLGGSLKKTLKKGQLFSTGWMDFQFRLLEFFPKSQRESVFEARDRPSDVTIKAIRVHHKGESTWLGQNSYVRFFKGDQVFVIGYLNKTYNLGFDLKLVDFSVKTYQGSQKAKSYESEVQLKDRTVVISMNEPLKQGGYTFYQSSFEPSETGGEPVVSILSVNRDPGRALKYLGSALIVLGIVLLFYRRKMVKSAGR